MGIAAQSLDTLIEIRNTIGSGTLRPRPRVTSAGCATTGGTPTRTVRLIDALGLETLLAQGGQDAVDVIRTVRLHGNP